MKKMRKSLSLNKETLARLNPRQLASANGGRIHIETQTCTMVCSDVTCDEWDCGGKPTRMSCACP